MLRLILKQGLVDTHLESGFLLFQLQDFSYLIRINLNQSDLKLMLDVTGFSCPRGTSSCR